MILALSTAQVLGDEFMFMYSSSREKSNSSRSKTEFQILPDRYFQISGRHVGVPRKDTDMAPAY